MAPAAGARRAHRVLHHAGRIPRRGEALPRAGPPLRPGSHRPGHALGHGIAMRPRSARSRHHPDGPGCRDRPVLPQRPRTRLGSPRPRPAPRRHRHPRPRAGPGVPTRLHQRVGRPLARRPGPPPEPGGDLRPRPQAIPTYGCGTGTYRPHRADRSRPSCRSRRDPPVRSVRAENKSRHVHTAATGRPRPRCGNRLGARRAPRGLRVGVTGAGGRRSAPLRRRDRPGRSG